MRDQGVICRLTLLRDEKRDQICMDNADQRNASCTLEHHEKYSVQAHEVFAHVGCPGPHAEVFGRADRCAVSTALFAIVQIAPSFAQ